MAKPGLSATDIGRLIGASPAEVNSLLRDQGFLNGDPGAYGLTPEGSRLGVQVHNDNGYRGVAYRGWSTTYFDPSILNVLDAKPENIAQAKSDVADYRLAQRIAAAALSAEADDEYRRRLEAGEQAAYAAGELDPKRVAIALTGLAVAIAAGFGVHRFVRWRRQKRIEAAVVNEAIPPKDAPLTDPK
jgi:hypothetical protein